MRSAGATTSRRNGKLVMHSLSTDGGNTFAALQNATDLVEAHVTTIQAVAR